MTLRLFLLEPDTYFTGRVNQADFTYPLGEVTYDSGAAVGTVYAGMTVLFGTSAGADDLGRTRLRDASIGATGTLKIGRSSEGTHDGEVSLEDDAYITILNDFRVWAKIPYIDEEGTIYKDHDIEVGTYTEDIPPVANAGVGTCGTIDGSDVLTQSWDASLKTFANSGSISSYLWDVDDGNITVGSTSTAAITVEFPAGFRWVHLTVTDSNAETHTMHMPVFARDPADDVTISAFNIEGHRITPDGQELAIRIRESIPESTYPDGTLVMIWEDEPVGASNRDHMLFIGWHHLDPASISAQRTGLLTDTQFIVYDVAHKLDSLPGLTQSISSVASPAKWTEMASPNMDKYLHYLLHWHSTALDLADWTNSGTGTDFPFVILGSDGESLWDQVQRRANALVPDYKFVCNTLGQMSVVVDPMLQDTGDRTSDQQKQLGEADWTSIEYTHQRPPRVHWLWSDAILASGSTISALFCVAPGFAPGQGETDQPHNEQLAKSQTDLNACEGHRYARINAPEGYIRVVLKGGDDFDLEPASMSWVTLGVTAATVAQRGQQFVTQRCQLKEVNITYDHARTGLVRTIELLLEKETVGRPALTYIPPEPDWDDDDDWIPPPAPPPVPPPTTGGSGFGTTYIFMSNKLVRTSDLSVTSPTWTDITGTITGTSYDFILDPWNPTTRAFALTDDGAWRITGLDGTPSATLVDSRSTAWYKIQASINVEDYIIYFYRVGSGNNINSLQARYSDDAGDTWSTVEVSDATFIADNRVRLGGGFDIVPHLVSGNIVIYAAYEYYKLASIKRIRVSKSSDGGATWSLVSNTAALDCGDDIPHCLNTPYHNNEDGDTAWLAVSDTDAGDKLLKSTDGFSSFDVIELGGADKTTNIKRLGIEVFIGNSNQVAIWASDNTFWKSIDGSNFSQVSFTGYVPGTHGNVATAGGFPSKNSLYYLVTDARYVFVSTDGGSSWIEKTGNLQSVITGGDPGISGIEKAVIMPVWVTE